MQYPRSLDDTVMPNPLTSPLIWLSLSLLRTAALRRVNKALDRVPWTKSRWDNSLDEIRTRLLVVSGISSFRGKERTWEAFTRGVGVNERPLIAFAMLNVMSRFARLVLSASMLITCSSIINLLQRH
jgi:hypothetical protein